MSIVKTQVIDMLWHYYWDKIDEYNMYKDIPSDKSLVRESPIEWWDYWIHIWKLIWKYWAPVINNYDEYPDGRVKPQPLRWIKCKAKVIWPYFNVCYDHNEIVKYMHYYTYRTNWSHYRDLLHRENLRTSLWWK